VRSLIQTVILTSGTLINSGLGLVFYLLIGRNLPVSSFGYFSFLLGIGILAADLGDLGVNASIIKLGHGTDFRSIFTVAWIQRLVVGAVLIVTAVIVQLFYPANFLLSALVGFVLLATYVCLQSLLAKQKYFSYALSNVLGNLVRLGVVWVLISHRLLSSETAIGSFLIGSLITLLVGFGIVTTIEKSLPFTTSHMKEAYEKMLKFGGWLGVSFGISAAASKIDSPLVFSLAGSTSAGLYASAQRIASVLPQISTAIDNVFSPKLAKSENTSHYFKQYLVLAVIACVTLLLCIPFAGLLISLTFGQAYLPAVPSFQIILLGFSIFLLSGPFTSSVIYRFGKTKLNVISSLGQLVISVISMALLIPPLGAVGAAIAFAITNLFSLAFFAVCHYNFSKKND
jgi:O-antigen/teichoic acid export membrane protein